ncbi:unnamed protein product [Somion occarium]|uniref:Uncharacterized protein n=1 Tax=Somion occarium TaxID=3059160 RepID=A0ABP1DMA9_9APHY
MYNTALHPPSILNVFPTELLSLVKESIPQGDLRTHVCFYKACPSFTALYGDETRQAAFWEGACILAGLGCLPNEAPENVDWKHVAFECIEKDGFCDHPACGGALLDWNAAQMKNMELDHSQLNWKALIECIILDGEEADYLRPEHSPVFQHFTFTPYVPHGIRLPIGEDVYLDRFEWKHQPTPEYQLRYHPIAQRSFALFPLVKIMDFMTHFSNTLRPTNPLGITVMDVLTALHGVVDTHMTVRQLSETLELLDTKTMVWALSSD